MEIILVGVPQRRSSLLLFSFSCELVWRAVLSVLYPTITR